MALALAAAHGDFLDINPRAVAYQLRNAAASDFEPTRFTVHVGDVAKYAPAEPYQILLDDFARTPRRFPGRARLRPRLRELRRDGLRRPLA